MKNKSYIFTRKNKHLQKMQQAWKLNENYGKYILCGKSGSGKTTFLNMIFSGNRNVKWYSCESIVNLCLEKIQTEKAIVLPRCQILIIEHIDQLLGKPYTLSKVNEFLNKLFIDENGNKKLIICTVDDERIGRLLDDFEIINIQPLPINIYTIIKLVKQKKTEGNFKRNITIN